MSTATDLIENASGMKAAQLSRRHFVAGMGALGQRRRWAFPDALRKIGPR